MQLTFEASMCTTWYVSVLAGATGVAVKTLQQQSVKQQLSMMDASRANQSIPASLQQLLSSCIHYAIFRSSRSIILILKSQDNKSNKKFYYFYFYYLETLELK